MNKTLLFSALFVAAAVTSCGSEEDVMLGQGLGAKGDKDEDKKGNVCVCGQQETAVVGWMTPVGDSCACGIFEGSIDGIFEPTADTKYGDLCRTAKEICQHERGNQPIGFTRCCCADSCSGEIVAEGEIGLLHRKRTCSAANYEICQTSDVKPDGSCCCPSGNCGTAIN